MFYIIKHFSIPRKYKETLPKPQLQKKETLKEKKVILHKHHAGTLHNPSSTYQRLKLRIQKKIIFFWDVSYLTKSPKVIFITYFIIIASYDIIIIRAFRRRNPDFFCRFIHDLTSPAAPPTGEHCNFL